MTDDGDIRVNPGYPLAQLLRVLEGKGERTDERAGQWRQVLRGLLDGILRIGSRTPVKDVPPWVTLEVVHGGFATGSLAAGGPLQAHEEKTLASLRRGPDAARATLNQHALGDGGAELVDLLASGRFRINVPEEGALLVAAWLLGRGETDRAARLVETIAPFFDRLRFYPVPTERPMRAGAGVHVQTVGAAAKSLRAKRPQPSIAKMREALHVWTPLYDRAVELFLETVEGETPSLRRTETGALARGPGGQPIVEGGWPCRTYPPDWRARGRRLLDDYHAARTKHSLCAKPEKRDENFARLRALLATCVDDPAALTGRNVGMIRKILASFVARHGAPNSPRWEATRRRQAHDAALPLHHELAHALAARLDALPQDEGAPEIVEAIDALPDSIVRKALRCWEAPIDSLIARGVISSSESMARVLPMLTARVRAAVIEDPALRRVYEAVYVAFRRRRSLLLLDLASQVKLAELPWVAAVEPWVGSDSASREAARETMLRATTTALGAFPYTILPNKLVRELQALATGAGLSPPLVEELAADIFMGTFAEKFLRAARVAARTLRGSLYERYYGLPYARVLEVDDVPATGKGAPASPGFAAICAELARVTPDDRWSVARNGTIIEQAQILTTHNLAVLFDELGLPGRLDLADLARRNFAWACRRHQMKIEQWQPRMRMVKNTAYAWRQMVFFLSALRADEVAAFLWWASDHLAQQAPEFASRFAPVLDGLRAVAAGDRFDADGLHVQSGGRRFLGWSIGRHWLLPET